jgi:predicted RNA-binding protein with PUA-like domain
MWKAMARRYWLMKSEPEAYSFDDLFAAKNRTDHWDGIRNYQARNNMMEMKKGDGVLFYHSSTTPPHVAGVAEVAREAYPDHTAWDKKSRYHDPKSSPENPRWYMVNLRADRNLEAPVTLEELKANPKLKAMRVVQKGSRLSVQPVLKSEFDEVLRMAREKAKRERT